MNVLLVVSLGVITVAAVLATALLRTQKRARIVARVADGGFLLAFSGLLADVAMADGEVTADEVDVVEKMFADMALSRAERAMCVGNFLLARREKRDAKASARELALSFNRIACLFLYCLLWRVANADWRVSAEEETLLKEIGGVFGIDADEQEAFRRGSPPAFDRLALEDAGVPPALVRLCAGNGIRDAGLGIWNR